MDWQAFVFNPVDAWMDRLNVLARRRFGEGSLADEAFNFAFEQISENRWERLNGFCGRSQPGSYLIAVFNNELEDFARKKFGRPRPPAWLDRMGETWLRIFKLLCLERREPETIVDQLCARDERHPDDVRIIIRTIRGRIPDCGQQIIDVVTDEIPQTDCGDTRALGPEAQLDQLELAKLFEAVAATLTSGVDAHVKSAAGFAHQAQGRWAQLAEKLKISDDERIVLRQVYQDGLRLSAVARNLGRPEHELRRMVQRTVTRLQRILEKEGFGIEALRQLLD